MKFLCNLNKKMDLHSGLPYWILKSSLDNTFNPLEKNISIDVTIIGSGITGALVAHELCEAGISCAVIDKRTLATGSSAASTAQLQYEIDTPLHQLIKKVGEQNAIKAFEYCLQSITDIENILKKTNVDAEFERIPTIYYTTTKKGLAFLDKEYKARKEANLPVDFLDKNQLWDYQKIQGYGALHNETSAQMDAYTAATGLLKYHRKKSNLKVFTHTEIQSFKENKNSYTLYTANSKKISCKYVIIATGFESEFFLPKKVMNLLSTYAIISSPVHPDNIWPNRSLLWNTDDPYLYLRTTTDNRMIVGGGDEMFENPIKRDSVLREKIKFLERKFKRLYPNISFKTEMAWCGTFSSTKDGLPFIGPYQSGSRMLFALGYGGNGITFSTIAAQVLTNFIKEKKDSRMKLFSFNR